MLFRSIFYALGYHVPENHLVYFRPEILKLGEDVTFEDKLGRKHMMTQRRRFVSLKPAGGTEQLTSSIGLPIMRAAFITPAWPMRHKPIVISPLNGRQTKYAIAMTICLSTMP